METSNKPGSYHITGRVYDTKPTFQSDNGSIVKYDHPVDKKEWDCEAADMAQAEQWLLEHHPDYYMGATIKENVPNGRMMTIPRPGSRYYSDGEYETLAGRRSHTKWVCEQLGYQLGPAEYGITKQRPLIEAPSAITTIYETQFGS